MIRSAGRGKLLGTGLIEVRRYLQCKAAIRHMVTAALVEVENCIRGTFGALGRFRTLLLAGDKRGQLKKVPIYWHVCR